MIGEMSLSGVFFPPMLLWALAAMVITALLRRLLAVTGFYRLVWHRPLFDLALLIIVLGGITFLAEHWSIL